MGDDFRATIDEPVVSELKQKSTVTLRLQNAPHTARNAGVHKSSLDLSTLRTQGLVNEPCTKMWKRCTRNWRKKCTRNQETPRSAACPRRCRACVLDEHLHTTPSRSFKRERSGIHAAGGQNKWQLSDVEDDELAVLRSYKDAVTPPCTSYKVTG